MTRQWISIEHVDPEAVRAIATDRLRVIEVARQTLSIEAEALSALAASLGPEFVRCVEIMLATEGRVICVGVGKSGHVARKIAATLSSTGAPALFIHPTEASHGDLGGDAFLLFPNARVRTKHQWPAPC